MSDYILSCCSTADLSAQHMRDRDIQYVCFHYELDGTTYTDDLGQSISLDDFYQAMEDGAMTKTTQANAEEYKKHFEKFLKDGKDILHLTLSSGISGTINSARIAAEDLREQYPDRKLYIVDSLGASSGFGLIMDTLADQRDAGMPIDELAQWIENHRLELQHWFFSTTLTYYIRGGRISKTAGTIGNILNICPLMNIEEDGHLNIFSKIRTKKKVIRAIVDQMKAHARDGLNYNGKCFISQSSCMEDAQAVASLVESTFPHLNGKVQIYNIGPTIGAHTGKGTVALFFWGDSRKHEAI